jgi:hypothetical protein
MHPTGSNQPGAPLATTPSAATFAGLGCPYQRERTGVLDSMIAA